MSSIVGPTPDGSTKASENDAIEDEDTMKDKYLAFCIGEENYGIDIRYVTEIVGILKITAVPGMPEYVKGVVNLRGKVFSVVDMRLRMGMPARPYDERTCLIVVEENEKSTGLIVDTVSEVMTISEDEVDIGAASGIHGGSSYLAGMGKADEDIVILIDAVKLLAGVEGFAIDSEIQEKGETK